ncbi:MAG: hypothetical protein ACYCZ7_00430, partial [Minisyncoccota bacterium]
MERFMVVMLMLVALSGCATQNPHFQTIQKVGATVAGGVAGYSIDRAMGGKGIVGGVAGAVVGHEIAASAQTPKNTGRYECVNCGTATYPTTQNPGVEAAIYRARLER